MKSKIIYLSIIFILLIFSSFLKEVAFYVNESLSNFTRALYVLPWVALVLFISFYFIKKIKDIKPWEFLGYSVFAGLIISLISGLLNLTFGLHNTLEKNYVGVYGITTGFNPNTESEEENEHKTNVYKISDNRAKTELEKLSDKYEGVSKEKFLFWQTAFANGFKPIYISEYKGTNSFNKVLTLFFTVGPIFLLETFVKTLMNSFIIFLIPIIGLFFKKKLFEEELHPIIEHFEKRGKKTA